VTAAVGEGPDDADAQPRVGTHLASMLTLSEVGIDFDRANAARIYDFFLGGAHNFASDRAQAAQIVAANPDMPRVCRVNRDYLGRAVRWCVDQGIDQFLDLGSGVPTVGNVHEIALRLSPVARIAYVDFEPVAVHHAREITSSLEGVTVTQADLRQPEEVLGAPTVAGLLDFTRPVAMLAIAVLHFIDDDVPAIFSRYRETLCPGSVLAINHGSSDQDDPALAEAVRNIERGYRGSATPVVLRDRRQIHDLLTGFELVPPGLVDPVDWPTPNPDAEPIGAYAGIGRLS
jgi:hypothetical protein